MSSPSALRTALESILSDCAALVRAAVPVSAHRKAHQDYVSDVDVRIDAHLMTALSALTPGVPILSEEREVALTAPVPEWWIVDPIDGTGNLLAGIPFVGISAALVNRDGPRVAAVAGAYQGKVWSAVRQGGAFVNGERLQIPGDASELIVASTGFLDRVQTTARGDAWAAIRRTGKVRNFGAQSLHLCGVAQGWFGAGLSVEARIWDEAAGGLIVREAGGVWHSRADFADWCDPATIMPVPQESIACHPQALATLAGIMPSTNQVATLRRQA